MNKDILKAVVVYTVALVLAELAVHFVPFTGLYIVHVLIFYVVFLITSALMNYILDRKIYDENESELEINKE